MRIAKIKLLTLFCLVLAVIRLQAQELDKNNVEKQQTYKVEGVVFSDETQLPLANVQISSYSATQGALTDSLGRFSIEVADMRATLVVSAYEYYPQKVEILNRSSLRIYVVPTSRMFSARGYKSVLGYKDFDTYIGTAEIIEGNDIGSAYSEVDNALVGKFAGLQVLGKGGMPGEGAYVNLRGTRSLIANNAPLIIIDGVPYDPSYAVSSVMTGYSRSIFSAVANKEVQSVVY